MQIRIAKTDRNRVLGIAILVLMEAFFGERQLLISSELLKNGITNPLK